MKTLLGWVMFLMLTLVGLAAPPGAPPAPWQEISPEQMDRALLTARATRVINDPSFTWRLAQTEHFVVHYEHGIFAAKVGRLAEFFYDYIGDDLTGMADRQSGRSHIFIFRKEKDWRRFQANHGPEGLAWSFSMVEGPVMYLQQAETLEASAEVLGHEMTHLVVNRFLTGELPLWLNEGMAEWYGEFAYAAAKGIKKSKPASFKGLSSAIPVDELLRSTRYPSDEAGLRAYYATSKYVVGFLRLERPATQWVPFVQAMVEGTDAATALTTVCGFADMADFVKAFDKFRR